MAGGNGSGTAGGDPDPDDLSAWDLPEGFVFDEEFVKGGVHEPPARTRESIARYGGQRTSWRQGAILEPTSAKRPTRRRLRIIATTLAVVAVIAGGSWFALEQNTKPTIPSSYNEPGVVGPETAGSGQADTATAATAAEAATDLNQVNGIQPYDPIGSCYYDPQTVDPYAAPTLDLDKVDCTEPHNYELVLVQTAAETSDGSYPTDDYWGGPVARSCEEQLEAYTGQRRSEWPDTLLSDFFIPRPDGWQAGHRNIECMAASTIYLTASVKA